jgi:hypothetical protein
MTGLYDQDNDGGPPPRTVTADGATIPAHAREDEVSPAMRGYLIELLEHARPAIAAQVERIAADLHIPNIGTHWFTRAHGALLFRLIEEAETDLDDTPDDDRQAGQIHPTLIRQVAGGWAARCFACDWADGGDDWAQLDETASRHRETGR